MRNLAPGRTYTLCEKPQADWDNTLPGPTDVDARGWACYTFSLASAEAVEAVVRLCARRCSRPPVPPPVPSATGGLRVIGAVPEDVALLFLPAVAASRHLQEGTDPTSRKAPPTSWK